MSIEGPQFPSNIPSNLPPNIAALFQSAAQGSVFSQLAALSPVSPVGEADVGLTPQQMNTFWFFRIYSECMTLYLVEDKNLSTFFGKDSASIIAGIKSDMQYMLSQQSTILDPQLVTDLTNYVNNIGSVGANIASIMQEYDSIIQENQTPNQVYDFSTLPPDDTFNYVLIQLGMTVYNCEYNNNQQNLPYWQGSSFLDMGQFFSSYLYQKNLNSDGTLNNPGLQNDINQLLTLLDGFQSFWSNQGMNPFISLINEAITELQTLQPSGQWTFSWPAPTGPNPTPAPWWDAPSGPPTWNYNEDAYLLFVDQDLAMQLPYFTPSS